MATPDGRLFIALGNGQIRVLEGDVLRPTPMIDLALTPMMEAVLALLIVLGMFVLFLRESYPTEVVAIGGAALMLVLGILPYPAALSVLSMLSERSMRNCR